MTREEIENNVGYWQEKDNLEYIRQRKEDAIKAFRKAMCNG